VPAISSLSDTFHRLLLQIGGANIAGADRALHPQSSSDSELLPPVLRNDLSERCRNGSFDVCAAKRSLYGARDGSPGGFNV
jgi:hypothetical protein